MSRLILSLDNLTTDQILYLLKEMSTLTDCNFPLWGMKVKPTTLIQVKDLAAIITEYYGLKLMVDAKLYDTPQAMEDQLHEYVELRADLVTVHMSAQFTPEDKTLLNNLVGVTVLTTFDDSDCQEVYDCTVDDCVDNFATDAIRWNYKNIVCSAKDLKILKGVENVFGTPLSKICPGIRPAWYSVKDDQKRRMTPGAAIRAGADLLVIGRPFLQFIDDPEKMLQAIYKTIEEYEPVLKELTEEKRDNDG